MITIKKNRNGITLIELIITIIIILILAGVTVSTLTGENGILNRSKESSEKYTKAQVKEEIELAIADIQAELYSDNEEIASIQSIKIAEEKEKFNMQAIVKYLPERLEVTSSELWTNTDLEEPEGKYKGYKFIIKTTYEVVIYGTTDNMAGDITLTSNNAIYFKGSTCITTDLEQSTIYANTKYTIATRIKINREQQQTVNLMGIIGTHNGSSGITLQFEGTTSNLDFVVNGRYDKVLDYTPYYNKWVDIIISCDGNTTKMYMNSQLVVENGLTAVPCGKFVIGSSADSSRAMKGLIYNAVIWNTDFTESEISSISLLEIQNVKNENKIFEEYLGSDEFLEKIQEKQYIMTGSSYTLESKNYEFTQQFKLFGGTYYDTGITQESIYANNQYTIATKVKIDQIYNLTGIIGTHNGSSGITLQFNNNDLALAINGIEYYLNYAQYLGKWAEIVITYDGTIVRAYINKEKKMEINATPIACGNFYIGTSLNTSRGMIGNITNTKVWKKALTEQQIQSLNLDEKLATTESLSIIAEVTMEDVTNSLIGTGYGYVYE